MTRPRLIRDSVGLHLVWGDWMVSSISLPWWRFGHGRASAHMGARRIDVWYGLGLRVHWARDVA